MPYNKGIGMGFGLPHVRAEDKKSYKAVFKPIRNQSQGCVSEQSLISEHIMGGGGGLDDW